MWLLYDKKKQEYLGYKDGKFVGQILKDDCLVFGTLGTATLIGAHVRENYGFAETMRPKLAKIYDIEHAELDELDLDEETGEEIDEDPGVDNYGVF